MVKGLEILIKELEQLPKDRQKKFLSSFLAEIRSGEPSYRDLSSVAEWDFWLDPSEDVYQEYLKK